MTTKSLLDEGKLSEALVEVKQEVKAHPTDTQLRTLLFELLSLVGDWEGGKRQLDVISHQESSSALAIEVYQQVLKAEEKRRQVFHSGREPDFFFQRPSYTQFHHDALTSLRANQVEEAKVLIDQSEQKRELLTGRVDGQPFSEFIDGDDRISPFLEVIVHESYAWVPFEQIKRLSVSTPKYLRDLIWLQADIEGVDGPIGPVFIPVLYVNSANSGNDQVRLGRMTQWESPGAGVTVGVGQRVFLNDGQDRGMLEVHEIEFDTLSRSEGNV
ncbi:MAG: type VI secretion system accessory protein TagJ [Nitrospirales bacterium]